MTGFLVICLVAACYAMVAQRLDGTSITAPMVFLATGVAVSLSGLLPHETSEALLHPIAESALVVLLFLDAARVDLKSLREKHTWPVRMLLVGLPLSIVLGTCAAALFFPLWPVAALALVAAILAPTDAALGQAVVTNPDVPTRLRRSMIVESGLNDGLALPAVLFFASLMAIETQEAGHWVSFAAKQLLLGPLAGVAVGAVGGWLLLRAQERRMTSSIYEGVAALALAGTAYVSAVLVGGNGFIAAFVAGLAFGTVVKGACDFVFEFTDSDGQLLVWASFTLLGAALVPEAVAHLTWPMFGLIAASLFLVRPLAIWMSLLGTRAHGVTRLFFGWFGPRGLATALFALLVLDDVAPEFGDAILHLAVNAVWISALLHGITAAPFAHLYARWVSDMGDCAEKQHDAEPLPASGGLAPAQSERRL